MKSKENRTETVEEEEVEEEDVMAVALTEEEALEKQNKKLENKKKKEAEQKNFSLADANAFANMVDAMKSGDLVMSNTELVEKIFILKEERQRILNTIKHRRYRLRFPIAEAAYCGKWETVHRIFERKLFHVHFSSTYAYPCPPPPRRRVFKDVVNKKHISMLTALAHGMSDLAAGEYIPGMGWVGANDARESYGESQEKLTEIWNKVMENRDSYIAARRRIRYLINAKRFQAQGEIDLEEAIRTRDYKRCIHIAQNGGGSIDHETKSGYTALIAAAEENVGSQTHAWMLNDGM